MKALLFARDPGGVNSVAPLIAPLQSLGYELEVLGKDAAMDCYQRHGVNARDIQTFGFPLTSQGLHEFLLSQKYDRIVTGTSADDNTEKYLWDSARKLSIPCSAVVDQWMMVGIRFSRFHTREIAQYEREKDVTFLPHQIFVTDEWVCNQAVRCGIPRTIIHVTGHPHFDQIYLEASRLNPSVIDRRRRSLSPEGLPIVTFASEPFSQVYESCVQYWGFTELTILTQVVSALAEESVQLVIRPHPKEALTKFQSIMANSSSAITVCDQSVSSLELIAASDVVCGMSSMFLVEAAVLGTQIVSTQIGLLREDPCILTRTGIIEGANDKNTLKSQLRGALQGKDLYKRPFRPPADSVQKIVAKVHNLTL